MPEKQKKSKKRREKKIKGGVWPFDLLKKDETAVVGEGRPVPAEPVAPEPKITEEELAGLKQKRDEAKVVYDAAKKEYNAAKPSMFGWFGGKTKKRRSEK